MTLLYFVIFSVIATLFILWPLRKNRWCWAIVPVVMGVFSVMIYTQLGAYSAVKHAEIVQAQSQQTKAEIARIKDPQQVVTALREHLKVTPDSAQGWYLLGRLYMSQQNFSEAEKSFSRAYHLQPNKEAYAIGTVEADFLAAHNRLSNQDKAILGKIKKPPYSVLALNLLGINAYLAHDYRAAVRDWEEVLPLVPAGSEDSQMVLSMLGQAQTQLQVQSQGASNLDGPAAALPPPPALGAAPALPPAPTLSAASVASDASNAPTNTSSTATTASSVSSDAENPASPVAPATPLFATPPTSATNPLDGQTSQPAAKALSVRVSISQDLLKLTHPDDVVFIFAVGQSDQGNNLPIASTRKQVKELPTVVVLSSSGTMLPQQSLTSYNNVIVMARIAKSGGLMAQPGDLQGQVTMNVQDGTTTDLVINQQIQ